MNIGDKIRNDRHGVNATDIPVGSTVKWDSDVGLNGVSGPTRTMVVAMRNGEKVLKFSDSPVKPGYPEQFIFGQFGVMTILDLGS